jgi:hypothetical protein
MWKSDAKMAGEDAVLIRKSLPKVSQPSLTLISKTENRAGAKSVMPASEKPLLNGLYSSVGRLVFTLLGEDTKHC